MKEHIDKIIQEVSEKIDNNIPFSPGQWLEAASNVNILMSDLDGELIRANMKVNRILAEHVGNGASAAKAKIEVQATQEYEDYLMLKARKESAEEFIRLAKKRVGLQYFDMNV